MKVNTALEIIQSRIPGISPKEAYLALVAATTAWAKHTQKHIEYFKITSTATDKFYPIPTRILDITMVEYDGAEVGFLGSHPSPAGDATIIDDATEIV